MDFFREVCEGKVPGEGNQVRGLRGGRASLARRAAQARMKSPLLATTGGGIFAPRKKRGAPGDEGRDGGTEEEAAGAGNVFILGRRGGNSAIYGREEATTLEVKYGLIVKVWTWSSLGSYRSA